MYLSLASLLYEALEQHWARAGYPFHETEACLLSLADYIEGSGASSGLPSVFTDSLLLLKDWVAHSSTSYPSERTLIARLETLLAESAS